MNHANRIGNVALAGLAAIIVWTASGPATQARKPQEEKAKPQHIQATAQGTSTQLGKMISVNINIREYSTPEDQQALFEAFKGGGQKGLHNALSKMSAKGRISITGTLGFDINYVRLFDTPTGAKIRLVTDRPVRFGEVWHSSRSSDYNLSAAEIEIGADKDKYTGVLLPACQFKLDKENHLEIETFQNPWKLVNVMVRD
jgi:hypothetical protein